MHRRHLLPIVRGESLCISCLRMLRLVLILHRPYRHLRLSTQVRLMWNRDWSLLNLCWLGARSDRLKVRCRVSIVRDGGG